jgi:hypothetical protein
MERTDGKQEGSAPFYPSPGDTAIAVTVIQEHYPDDSRTL